MLLMEGRELLEEGKVRVVISRPVYLIAGRAKRKAAQPGTLLNGKLLEVEGSKPLGLFESAEPSLLEFLLAPGDRLLLLSDGIAEAMDERGNLFAFKRELELMRTLPTAAKIADTAQAFGQEDDISVIAVTRELD